MEPRSAVFRPPCFPPLLGFGDLLLKKVVTASWILFSGGDCPGERITLFLGVLPGVLPPTTDAGPRPADDKNLKGLGDADGRDWPAIPWPR